MITDPLTDAARAVVADARRCYPAGLPRGVYVAVCTEPLIALENALSNLAAARESLVTLPASTPPARHSGADTEQEMPVMATKKAAPKQAPKVKAAKPKAVKRPAAKKAPDNGGAADNGATT